MANNAKIKKWLLSKGQNQAKLRKSWSKDYTEIVTLKSFIETPDRSKVYPRLHSFRQKAL